MNKKIKSLLKQAEVYKTQGLLDDAGEKYRLVAELIQTSEHIQNKDKLLNAVSKKIAALKRHTEIVEQAPTTPEMSEHVNTLIKKLFSFSKDQEKASKEEADLEGAIALAKFGQFDSALKEFEKLIPISTVRLPAAKNILRCHVALDSIDMASEQFSKWESEELFSNEQLENIRNFFNDLLAKKKIKRDVAPAKPKDTIEEQPAETITAAETVEAEPNLEMEHEDEDEEDEEFLDISAVAITFDSGPHKGEQVELDVSFQSGNIISLIISSKDESLIENLQVGCKLDDVHFYSPIAIFRGSGTVSAMTKIASGPKQGDFSLDIKIESI